MRYTFRPIATRQMALCGFWDWFSSFKVTKMDLSKSTFKSRFWPICNRARRYYRYRLSIVRLVGLSLNINIEISHPWVSVSVSISNFYIPRSQSQYRYQFFTSMGISLSLSIEIYTSLSLSISLFVLEIFDILGKCVFLVHV